MKKLVLNCMEKLTWMVWWVLWGGHENELRRPTHTGRLPDQLLKVLCSKIHNLVYVKAICSLSCSQIVTENGRNTKAGLLLEGTGHFWWATLAQVHFLMLLPNLSSLQGCQLSTLSFPSLGVRFCTVVLLGSQLLPSSFTLFFPPHTEVYPNKNLQTFHSISSSAFWKPLWYLYMLLSLSCTDNPQVFI